MWLDSLHKVFFLNFVKFYSNVVIEEFVLSNLRASPFTKPFFTPGGSHDVKNVYWNVSSFLKCVLMSTTDSLLNLWPFYIVVSKKVASVHDISAVNLTVGWCLFAC